jgi:hypothetical protein
MCSVNIYTAVDWRTGVQHDGSEWDGEGKGKRLQTKQYVQLIEEFSVIQMYIFNGALTRLE